MFRRYVKAVNRGQLNPEWFQTTTLLLDRLTAITKHVRRMFAEPAANANFLSDRARSFESSLHVMMSTRHLEAGPHPVVASGAREVLNKSDNERSGVLPTTMRSCPVSGPQVKLRAARWVYSHPQVSSSSAYLSLSRTE